eukprot:s7664_g1.t1
MFGHGGCLSQQLASHGWKYGVPLDLALSFLSWRDLVPASTVCTALLTAESGRPLCCCSTAGPLRALPSSDGALRWLARRAADGSGGGLHCLKISDTACHHTDAGAFAISRESRQNHNTSSSCSG